MKTHATIPLRAHLSAINLIPPGNLSELESAVSEVRAMIAQVFDGPFTAPPSAWAHWPSMPIKPTETSLRAVVVQLNERFLPSLGAIGEAVLNYPTLR